MPIFLELRPVSEYPHIKKKMYSVENMETIEEAGTDEEYTRIIFNENSTLSEVIVAESYLDIYKTLNELNLVEEVIKDNE